MTNIDNNKELIKDLIKSQLDKNSKLTFHIDRSPVFNDPGVFRLTVSDVSGIIVIPIFHGDLTDIKTIMAVTGVNIQDLA